MGPLWQPPPQGPKNDAGETLSGHSGCLLRLAKVTQKRGFSRRFPGGFPTVFASGLPAVLRGVFQRFPSGFQPVSRQFDNGFPAVLPVASGSFPTVLPPVFQRFSSRFASGLRQFSNGFAAGFPTVRWQHASPGSTPSRLRHPGLAPSSPRWTWPPSSARSTGGEEIFKADKWSVDSIARYVEDRIG